MTEFSFSDIVDDNDDIIVVNQGKGLPLPEDIFEDEDIEDVIIEDEDEDVEDIEDDDENISDLIDSHDLTTLDDDDEIKIGDLVFTKGDITGTIKMKEEVESRKAQLEEYFTRFSEIDQQMNERFVASITETDWKLDHYHKKLRDPNLTHADKGEIYEQIEKLNNNKEILNRRTQEYLIAKNAREQEAEMMALRELNNTMAARYGKEWVDTLAPSLTQYAVDVGIASPALRKALSPELMEVLIKAQKYDHLKKKSSDKVNEVVKSKSKVSPKSVNTKAPASRVNPNKKAAIEKAMNKGKQIDPSLLFEYLDD